MRKRDYWYRKALFATGAKYLMAFGQNSAGKSYQAKEEAIEQALKGRRFFYIKRWDTELKQDDADRYFDNMDIPKYTHGEWDGIKAYHGYYYWYRVDESGKIVRSENEIGAYGALNMWQKYKSNVYINYFYIIFEEFISKDIYITNEPTVLQRFVTIVFRENEGVVFMLGNTISRTTPYFIEWCPNVINQKQGTIEIYHMHDAAGEGLDVDIAVEYTGHIKNTGSMFFGEASKSIMGGEWHVDNRPKLPKAHEDYEKVYEIKIIYQQFSFILELMVDPENGTTLIFVYPATRNRKVNRIITNEFSDDRNVTRYFKDNKIERKIASLIYNNKCCFSDNLTASDFYSVYKMLDL